MEKRKKCLFLFTELAGYIVACMKHLAANQPAEVHVVRWPVNAVAPFQFSLEGDHITFYERKNFNDAQLLEFAKKLDPDIILCSGWIDKGYNNICRNFKNRIPTVLGLDNPWRRTARQQVAALAGRYWLKNYFTHCWVPGSLQKQYANKLGFSDAVIKTGAYSCDFEKFHQQYLANREKKIKHFPKKIIFVGRYTRLKGTTELWDAFVKFQQQTPSEWELWCLGKGELNDKFPQHEKIKNVGFVQPDDMHEYISMCGVFILPSHYEHWGVVVHEFAAAGFPVICTTTTGAAEEFLIDGHNGFAIPPYDVNALVDIFTKLHASTSDDLLAMGDRSAELAKKITPETWGQTFMNFLKA
jgi:glycosyltransferase involved in cell wall biosynthesis